MKNESYGRGFSRWVLVLLAFASLAAAQTYTITGTTEKATSSLPFIQVQPCVKQ